MRRDARARTVRSRVIASRSVAASLVAWAVVTSGCATAKPQPLQVAAAVDHVSFVVVGGERARGRGRRGGASTNWAQQVFQSGLADQATMVNLGRAGFTAADGSNLQADLDRLHPTVGALWVGDDEALRSVPIATFRTAFAALLDRLKAAGVTRLLVAVIPPWDDAGLTAAAVGSYNEVIRAVSAVRPFVTLVDLTPNGGKAEDDPDAIAKVFIAALKE